MGIYTYSQDNYLLHAIGVNKGWVLLSGHIHVPVHRMQRRESVDLGLLSIEYAVRHVEQFSEGIVFQVITYKCRFTGTAWCFPWQHTVICDDL